MPKGQVWKRVWKMGVKNYIFGWDRVRIWRTGRHPPPQRSPGGPPPPPQPGYPPFEQPGAWSIVTVFICTTFATQLSTKLVVVRIISVIYYSILKYLLKELHISGCLRQCQDLTYLPKNRFHACLTVSMTTCYCLDSFSKKTLTFRA